MEKDFTVAYCELVNSLSDLQIVQLAVTDRRNDAGDDRRNGASLK
jgi:hypothetical protein